MPDESEAKFQVDNLERVRRALRAAGARYLETVIQTDVYFDTPDESLREHQSGMRIRHQRTLRSSGRSKGQSATVTFKGPLRPNANIKIRPELQAPVSDPEELARLFQSLGLEIVMKLQKRRASYQLASTRVELDELPLIGCFVEIEGPSEKAILAAAGKLKLRGKPIIRPYVDLLTEHCNRTRISAREVLFEK